ncbi:MAG: reverse transcriptase-like protein [Actinomycetota bacterium]
MAKTTHRLYTDGGARGNPGPAGFGVVLETSDGELVEEVARGIGWATNNVAEYEGLIEGLRTALRNGVKSLAVYMDSTLVIQQMRGAFKVKNPGLKPLHATAAELASQFDHVQFQAIPRERNKHADRLSNQGMDACRGVEPSPAPQAGQQTLL